MDINVQKQLFDLAEKRNTKDYEWTRNVLLMASSLLGILVSFHSSKSSNICIHYVFSITIGTLGFAILCGTVFLYSETSTLHRLLKIQAQKASSGGTIISVVRPLRIFQVMRILFYLSSAISVISLVTYAIIMDIK